jgi:hypothetical protein
MYMHMNPGKTKIDIVEGTTVSIKISKDASHGRSLACRVVLIDNHQ